MDIDNPTAQRAALVERGNLASGFASFAKGTVRHNLEREAKDCFQAAILLSDWIDGKPSQDIEAMTDDEIIAALTQ